jgi:uncharacterized protein YydD (DUF2326 family)
MLVTFPTHQTKDQLPTTISSIAFAQLQGQFNLTMVHSPADYNSQTVKQLRTHLKKRPISDKGLTRKAQLVAALEEDNNIPETEQIEEPSYKDLRAAVKERKLLAPSQTREDPLRVLRTDDERIRR